MKGRVSFLKSFRKNCRSLLNEDAKTVIHFRWWLLSIGCISNWRFAIDKNEKNSRVHKMNSWVVILYVIIETFHQNLLEHPQKLFAQSKGTEITIWKIWPKPCGAVKRSGSVFNNFISILLFSYIIKSKIHFHKSL